VLFNEPNELRDLARDAGFKVYRTTGFFKKYVQDKVLSEPSDG